MTLLNSHSPATCPRCKGTGLLTKPARTLRLVPVPSEDPRLPTNLAPHREEPYSGPAVKGAAAAKERRRRYAACGCRLCALALNPPLTFAEAKVCGLEGLSMFVLRSVNDAIDIEATLAREALYAASEARTASEEHRMAVAA